MTSDQNEAEFLAQYDIHDYDVPLATVDVVVFRVLDGRLQVLLVFRGEHPERHKWALPGGFVDVGRDADLYATALRKLREKTRVATLYLEQLGSFGDGKRDPRGWSLTVVYLALLNDEATTGKPANKDQLAWLPLEEAVVKPLAFDHQRLIRHAWQRLRNKATYTALPTHLLPEAFTLGELQEMYELILGGKVDKSAFRRRIRDAAILDAIPGAWKTGANRPAQLYRLAPGKDDYYFLRPMTLPQPAAEKK